MCMSLNRLQELCGGAIVIDGVDIAKMGLKQLRSSMAIIPQVPYILIHPLHPAYTLYALYIEEAITIVPHSHSSACHAPHTSMHTPHPPQMQHVQSVCHPASLGSCAPMEGMR